MSGIDHAPTRQLSILVIAGPTAVGKTQIASELARRYDGELIGADSVQVYRGFDIGSSKPTPEERRCVMHHMIDIREPAESLDAASYAALADQAIADVHARGKLPIVVGGTGLWLRALLRGLVALPPVDSALRAQLEREWDAKGGAAMHVQLMAVDPISAGRIHPNDKLRVVRALEVHAQTGQPLGAARLEHALGSARYRDLTFVLDLAPVHHRERVAARTREMLGAGFAAEVAHLLEEHGRELRPLHSVGYKQMVEHHLASVPIDETERAIVRATLLYARRQRTWWKSDQSVRARLTPEAALSDEAKRAIQAHLGR
jgi:tRNA dimethylallyltransferase